MRNLLITGGAGFIGSNYVRYVLQNHPDLNVVVFDKLTYAGNLDNLRDLEEKFQLRYKFVKGDICDAEVVNATLREHHIDTIVNFAAESHVDRSLLTPDAFIKTDVNGTHVLLEAAKNLQLERYHQVSTDEVYGDVPIGSSKEIDPLAPRSPYSASKASGDLLVQAYHVSFGVPTTITRGSNTYGPYQYPEKLLPLFITNAIDDQWLPVYGDGMQVRDWLFVMDHCSGIDLVLHRGTDRRNLQRRRRERAAQHRCDPYAAEYDEQTGIVVTPRDRSRRARSPLFARRVETACPRLGTERHVRAGTRRDRQLVQSRMNGGGARSRAASTWNTTRRSMRSDWRKALRCNE